MGISSRLFCSISLLILNPDWFSLIRYQDPPQYEVTVTLKLISVYVMDKDGLPVTDLRKEDFVLSDNKRRMTISDFERHLPSDLARSDTGQADEDERPSRKRGGGKSIFLFIDYAFNNRFGLKKAKEAALYFIDTRLQPDDQVGIISYSKSKSLTLDAELTANHAKIRGIVEDINPENVNRRVNNVEEDYWVLRGVVPPTSKYLVREYDMLDVKTEREFYKYHVSILFDNMNSLASALLHIKGHKNIIYFSSGVASSIMYDSPISAYHDGNDDREAQRLRKAYEAMINNLGSADCSFFIMDTGELGEVIPERRYLTGAPSLQRLSEGTGGVYFDNPDGYRKIMDDIHTITNSYYVLGYYVHEAWNGNYHRISVTVNRKGLHVYTRRGYFEPKPFPNTRNREKRKEIT